MNLNSLYNTSKPWEFLTTSEPAGHFVKIQLGDADLPSSVPVKRQKLQLTPTHRLPTYEPTISPVL